MTANPVLVEVTRGNIVESFHRGAFAVVDAGSTALSSRGDVSREVFPRSAIKALQALPLVESGAAKFFGFTPDEIALACSSHNGEPKHVQTVQSMLRKSGLNENALECGTHWPLSKNAGRDLATANQKPSSLHNNCSGKHAGMLATSKFLGEEFSGYIERNHPVQQRIEAIISEFCECDLTTAACGVDGCSVPTWAMPLENLATGFAKFASSNANSGKHTNAGMQILEAARNFPFMVAGTDRFCTNIMTQVPRLFAKTGAEGVFCGAIPHAGIGIAVKCDDGTTRAAEVMFASVARSQDIWTAEENTALERFSNVELKNCNGMVVGELRACLD